MVIKQRLTRVTLAVAAVFSLGSAQAAEWVAVPSVSLSENFNDNFRLTSADHENVWGTIIDPRLRLSRRSDIWDLNASGRVRFAKYNQNELDTNDTFFDLAAKRRFERGSLDASASLINDTTLQDEVLDLDTGVTIVQIDRTKHNFEFGGQYMLTEATWLEASIAYGTVDYDGGEQFGLLDYTDLTPELRMTHQLDPKTQIFGILNHSKVDYDVNTDLQYTSDSLQFGAAYDVTETWNISGSVGGRRTDTSSLVVDHYIIDPGPPAVLIPVLTTEDSTSNGVVYDASLTRKFETGSLNLSASQSIAPNKGTSTEKTSVTLEGTRAFSAKLSGNLAVSFLKSSNTTNSVTAGSSSSRDKYRVSPRLDWRLDRDLALNAGYSYTRIERGTNTRETVDSNAVFIGLTYNWPRLAVSR